MSHNLTAVYPGTFDPITLGHLDLVRRSCGLFTHVVVAVAVAHHKKTMFTLDERLALVRESTADLPAVRVESFSGLVRDFIRAQGAHVMVRGVRSVVDFEYEHQLLNMNRHLMPEVETIFLTPTPSQQFTSSTLVREIANLGGDVTPWVAPSVLAHIQAKTKSKG